MLKNISRYSQKAERDHHFPTFHRLRPQYLVIM
uniref:Uncharacterized protein n=1 Tax=Arundo donax TaxID=35708 RepID=A0A0A8YQ11_ARUDO